MKGRNFALGALVGVAAGVIAGLLTAPRSGRQARADIVKQARRLKTRARKRQKLRRG